MSGVPNLPGSAPFGVASASDGDLPSELRHVHLVGIGGAGMSGIARILLARGAVVSGSDARESRVLAALRAAGATVVVGHAAENVPSGATVVVSTAIRETNAELGAARATGAHVLRRAEALAGLMLGSRGVAVAGTHGKTTTTSMLTVALQQAGMDPSFAIGGDLNEAGSNAHAGSGDVFVAEADESDGSFLLLSPHGAIITNVEPEHLDHYGSGEAVDQAFADFLARIDGDGFLVLCLDDPGSAKLVGPARAAGLRVVTYGESDAADVQVVGVRSAGRTTTYEAVVRGRRLGPVRLAVPGRHNALNSAAVLAAGLELGVGATALRDGLAAYQGVRRRFDFRGSMGGVRVVDDYAHHPTEIDATLRAASSAAEGGRVLVAFQPHRYSRTAAFAGELGEALGLADGVVVMEVYAAGEDPIPGVSGATVAAAVPLPSADVVFEPSWSKVAGRLAAMARPGDLVLTMGAGDVTLVGPEVLRELEADANGGADDANGETGTRI
ncbi:MAG: UDP-N-acetylmuramate--alanine ligase [Frankiaceae bacterium]|nr:UDP-N-acetylmuramate--alanine ligase [Frankiaceae bacterium]